MDDQQQGSQRARNASIQVPFSSSFSTSSSSMPNANNPGPMETPSRALRPLPGYSNSPDFLASRLDKATAVPQQGSPLGVGTQRPFTAISSPVATSNKPYQSRERVYYQQTPISTTKAGATQSQTTFSVKQNEVDLKADIPPAGSLYDDPLSPDHHRLDQTSQAGNLKSKEIDYLSGMVASSPGRVVTGSSLKDYQPASINVESTDPLDCWVTVFGFSGAQTQSVLAYFKTVGNIVKTELGQRNWLHLQFESPWAAQKALLKNGSVLPAAGSCMIGVLPTKMAMDQVGLASTSFMSPLKKGKETLPSVTSPFAQPSMLGPSMNTSAASSQPPQTPGFPQSSIYASMTQQHQPTAQSAEGPVPSIFAAEAAREKASQATVESAATGSEGLITKTFNYIFGF